MVVIKVAQDILGHTCTMKNATVNVVRNKQKGQEKQAIEKMMQQIFVGEVGIKNYSLRFHRYCTIRDKRE